jgi:hypothetical protein
MWRIPSVELFLVKLCIYSCFSPCMLHIQTSPSIVIQMLKLYKVKSINYCTKLCHYVTLSKKYTSFFKLVLKYGSVTNTTQKSNCDEYKVFSWIYHTENEEMKLGIGQFVSNQEFRYFNTLYFWNYK